MNVMRRYLYVFGLLLGVFGNSYLSAQDLIVTINNDSLNVKIEKETDRFVYYVLPSESNNSLVMSKKQISDVVYSYYLSSAPTFQTDPDGKPIESQVNVAKPYEEKLERIQLSGSIGYARLLVVVDEDNQVVKDYYNKLLNGYNYSFQFNYLFSKRIGIGLMYESAHFSNSIDASYSNPNAPPSASPAYGQVSDDITLQHFGTNFIFRIPFKRSASAIQFDAGFGYSTYRNNAEIVYEYEMTGETLGLSVGAAYQLNVGGGLYIPMRIGLKSALFTNIDLETADDMPDELKLELDSELENSLGISGERLSLSIGLLYAF